MKIIKKESRTPVTGPASWFTGNVTIDPMLLEPESPGRTTGAQVTFEAGARTAWHAHPAGQMLIVTAGRGLVQEEGGPVQEIAPGDVVWFPADSRHWHGAAPDSSLTHIAIQEVIDGSSAEWMEHVSDEQYKK